MATIIGDVLLSSAYLAYAGYFDQHYRHSLLATWTEHLSGAGIQFRPDIALTEYLSNPDERLRWQANALPSDDLCTENAITLKVCIDLCIGIVKYLKMEYVSTRSIFCISHRNVSLIFLFCYRDLTAILSSLIHLVKLLNLL